MPAANDNEGTARVFLALWPDAAARARLADCRDAWRWPPGARLVGDAKLHLTLHFIGALARSPLDDLQAALAEVPPGRVALHLPGGELWKGGIAVLLAASPAPALLALHDRLGRALDAIGVAFDRRPFAPHVTLARKARGAEPPVAAAVDWEVDAFALVESRGGAYRVMRRFGPAEDTARRDAER